MAGRIFHSSNGNHATATEWLENMLSIAIRDTQNSKYYRAAVSISWAKRHDNGALISCGLTIDEPSAWSGHVWLTRRAFDRLQKTGAVKEITHDQWNHSGCQSSCVLRGAKECRW
jgi:hypothetical protein